MTLITSCREMFSCVDNFVYGHYGVHWAPNQIKMFSNLKNV